MENNYLKWYNFRKGAKIIEINKETDLEEIAEKYDYVILYDLRRLHEVKKLINENGIILLLVDNRFSVASFAGAKIGNNNPFEAITENYGGCYSKNEIESAIKKERLKYRFYYLLPNYKNPSTVFSDDYLPDSNDSKLMYNIDYAEGSMVVFDELKLLKQVTKDGRFKEFANSYVVEIGTEFDIQPRFVSFNNGRKANYRLITKIYEDYVEKIPENENALSQIKQIESNSKQLKEKGLTILDERVDNAIRSKFVKLPSLDKVIVNYMLENNTDEAIRTISKYRVFLGSHLNDDTGYIDLVFENVFLDGDNYIFFDQEWYEKNANIDFILYRALKNMYNYNRELNSIISFEKMLDIFELKGEKEEFEIIEKEFQEKVVDKDMLEKNKEAFKYLVDINEVRLIEDFKENNRKQDAVIQDILEDNRKKQEYITALENRK